MIGDCSRGRLFPWVALLWVAGVAGVAGNPGVATAEGIAARDSSAAAPAARSGFERRPLRDVGRTLQILGSDGWALASSPARMDRGDALFVLGTAAATAVVFANDEAILRASLRNGSDPTYRAVLRVGYNLEPFGLMGNTLPYYFATMALGYAADSPTLALIPAEIIESHFLAGGLRNLSKLFLGRRRPFESRGPRAFEFDGGTSFPSGHTSVVFEVATVLSEHARRWPVTAVTYGLAATVAIQRVDSGNHWASDVIVPAITGTLIARTIVDRHRRTAWAAAPEESRGRTGAMGGAGETGRPVSWAVLPGVTPSGGAGVRLAVGF
jgi:membrane-associated phospholipid phosphatase